MIAAVAGSEPVLPVAQRCCSRPVLEPGPGLGRGGGTIAMFDVPSPAVRSPLRVDREAGWFVGPWVGCGPDLGPGRRGTVVALDPLLSGAWRALRDLAAGLVVDLRRGHRRPVAEAAR